MFNRTLALGAAIAATFAAATAAQAAATFVIDDYTNPTVANIYAAAGVATVANATEPGPPVRSVFADSYINPLNGVTTVTSGSGLVTLASPPGARAEVLLGYGAFAGASQSVDTTPYNFIRLNFARATDELNLNVLFYSASPTGPNNYYLLSAINANPAAANNPFTVYIPISSLPGFNRADVNGFLLLIDRSGSSFGASWALDSFALTSNIPEPTAWALMIVGFGLTGAALRRRSALVHL